jgi:hypothetical protein
MNTASDSPVDLKVPDLNLDARATDLTLHYESDVRHLPILKGQSETIEWNSLDEFERNAIVVIPIQVRVYQANGTSVKVIVPEEYASRLDQLANLERQAGGGEPEAEQARRELASAEMEDIAGRMTVRDAFRYALMTPQPSLFREIYLSGESNPYDGWFKAKTGNSSFESSADTVLKEGRTTWYKKCAGPVLAEDTMHEWAHLFDEHYPLTAQIIRTASRVDKVVTRSYAELPRERIAIEVGEYALHPNGDRASQLIATAPVLATAIGEGLVEVLSRVPESERSLLHEQWLARADMMRSTACPMARRLLIDKAQAQAGTPEGENALLALIYLGQPDDLQALTSVTSLDLSFQPLGEFYGCRLGMLPNLREVNLHATFVGPQTVHALAGRPLERLDLGGTQICSSCMCFLPDTLRHLDLSGTRIGDSAVRFLSRLQSLESLDVGHTSITATELDTLREALPKTRIDD